MKNIFLVVILFLVGNGPAYSESVETLKTSGLKEPVEIVKDKWGISHIYAKNQSDLFFAQGYNAARDRLFQFEIWRRKALGTLAEIQGDKALTHDRGARLLRFRGDIRQEMAHYHKDGIQIITSFVEGINAYIKLTEKRPDLLPLEFKMLDLKPGYWTPEIVVSRHNALTGGVSTEIMLAETIEALGAETAKKILPFYRKAYLKAFEGVDLSKIHTDIMSDYVASRNMPEFEQEDLKNLKEYSAQRLNQKTDFQREKFTENLFHDPLQGVNALGSNNWVVSGRKTKSGMPLMANDPHRAIQSPSLRYWVHLNAPGWNVIGGGEPVLPGISIGHNAYGAWGLTIFWIDQEDLYVYETNPDQPNQYWYKGEWKDFEVEKTRIKVRGKNTVTEVLKYSIHGPVLFEDQENHIAYGMKAAWLDIGATPYLASLRMDQATTWEEFRDACSFSGLPGENMVWADQKGNIGWQSVGLSPVRFGWSGSLPVPGNGEYEWSGYVPVKSMPHLLNPQEGWYGTANNYNIPDGYPNIFSDFYSDPARIFRLQEAMEKSENHSIKDSIALQYDTKSMTAEKIISLFKNLKVSAELKAVRSKLINWDYMMGRDSVAATIYDKWETVLFENITKRVIPETKLAAVPEIRREKILEWLVTPPEFVFGKDAVRMRNTEMVESLKIAVQSLKKDRGPDMEDWIYGKTHYAQIIHPFSHLLNKDMQEKVNTAQLPRGGSENTLNVNYGAPRQTSGGSFRIIVDTSDWDLTVGTNTPGQSGDPDSPYYKNLFTDWNEGDYFPVFYTKEKIKEVTDYTLRLLPD
ncbi:penicillin acylase family protein [Emcibacter sp.]|uniref:penicillin acylase family protein n=1 Tax=Emcibacter sp. TaxID=1979954 RepID=UPI002AA5F07C|nr:penicillin acylase family protein [Emcibacter sp.]